MLVTITGVLTENLITSIDVKNVGLLMSKEGLEKTEQINKETDINEVLVALYEAELRYNQEYERIRYEEETLRKIPDLKSKMRLVELECKYNHLIRRYKVELERIKKEEND